MTPDARSRLNEWTPEMTAAMEKYGITRFPVYYFQLRQYKYANLKDAIAQAERDLGAE